MNEKQKYIWQLFVIFLVKETKLSTYNKIKYITSLKQQLKCYKPKAK